MASARSLRCVVVWLVAAQWRGADLIEEASGLAVVESTVRQEVVRNSQRGHTHNGHSASEPFKHSLLQTLTQVEIRKGIVQAAHHMDAEEAIRTRQLRNKVGDGSQASLADLAQEDSPTSDLVTHTVLSGRLQHDKVNSQANSFDVASRSGGRHRLPVVILFLVLGLLSAVSVGFYAYSVMTPDSAEAPLEAAVYKTVSMPEVSTSQPAGLQRRNTVIVGELQKKHWTIDQAVGTCSEFSFVVNMFCDIAPAGFHTFLPLVAGLKHTGYIPSFVIMFLFYSICVYTMYAVAQTAQITGARDYASQWSRCVSAKTAWVPVLVVVMVTFGTTVSYSCFFADIFAGVLPSLGLRMSRKACLLAFTLFPTMPLCLVKDLSALSSTSAFAMAAVLYTAGVMVIRWLDGTYAPGGKYIGDLDASLAPQVPSEHFLQLGLPSLALMNSLAQGFLTHYNACKYYRELVDHTPARLARYTSIAMGLVVILFALVMVSGFQTFGTNADSVILRNYSSNDTAINAARLGMGFARIASFPLMFSGLREAIITLLKQLGPSPKEHWDLIWRQDVLSIIMLSMITGIAWRVSDAGKIVGVVGSIFGISIIYIVPSVLYSGAIHTFLTERDLGTVVWLRLLVCMGTVLAVAGCIITLAR